jgi:uncharacterized membrane protein
MIKKIAQEFLWLIFSVLAAIPLSFLFLSCIEMVESSNEIVIIEFFIAGIIINVMGIYLVRIIVASVKKISE